MSDIITSLTWWVNNPDYSKVTIDNVDRIIEEARERSRKERRSDWNWQPERDIARLKTLKVLLQSNINIEQTGNGGIVLLKGQTGKSIYFTLLSQKWRNPGKSVWYWGTVEKVINLLNTGRYE